MRLTVQNCLQCNSPFKPRRAAKLFCCVDCYRQYIKPKNNTTCNYCTKEFHKEPGNITKHNFCSKSCSATYNNLKKGFKKKCKHCEIKIPYNKILCSACKAKKFPHWSTLRISDIQRKAKYQVSAYIRTVAREVYASGGKPRVCNVCGYNKHIEICHIKPIKSFSELAPLVVVNSLDNLIALCPNCHWEFDNGFITLS